MKGNSYDVIGLNEDSIKHDEKITINESKPAAPVSSEDSNPTPADKTDNKFTNAFSGFKNFVARSANSITGNTAPEEPAAPLDWRQKAIKAITSKFEVEKSYKIFFIVLSIGLGFVCLSLIFLPFIVISPQKFVMCFGLGSLLILVSFLFMLGTAGYFEVLFSKQRFPFTCLFLASIILGIYFSYAGQFFLSLICAGGQLISLVIFVLSFTPGGQTGIRFIGRSLASPFTNFWMKLRGQSELPS